MADADAEAAKLVRRVDRSLGTARDKILRALAAGPCNFEELVARVEAERAERLRAAGIAGAKPKGPAPITKELYDCERVVARYTGVRCRGPRDPGNRHLAHCTFELNPYGEYVAAHPTLFYRDGDPASPVVVEYDVPFDEGTRRVSGRLSLIECYGPWGHGGYAKLQFIDPAERDTFDAKFCREQVAKLASLYEAVAERAAAAGVEPPPRPHFLRDL